MLAQRLNEPIATYPGAVRPGDREVIGEWAMDMAFRASREETLLCEIRCVLALVTRKAGPPPVEISASVDEQLARHRTHRAGDRNALRDSLESTIQHLESGTSTVNSVVRVAALRQ